MKRVALAVMALCCAVSVACAQEAAKAEQVTVKGIVIDNMCAGAHQADIAEFVKTHTKECALAPACAASGYSIYADGKLIKLDKASNAKVEEFLKNAGTPLEAEVIATKNGEELSVISISNVMKEAPVSQAAPAATEQVTPAVPAAEATK